MNVLFIEPSFPQNQREFVRALRIRADLTMSRLGGIPGIKCVAPQAAFYVMPQVMLPKGKTDEGAVPVCALEADRQDEDAKDGAVEERPEAVHYLD